MKIRTRTKNAIRRIFYILFFFKHEQLKENNIFLFSTRRGGSTWLSQLLSCDQSTRYVDHALGYLNMDFVERSYLPKVYLNQYIEPDRRINEYFDAIEKGKLTSRAIANPFSPDFVRKSQRLVYKITEGKALINWLSETRKGYFVFQFRHPISNALSIIRNGWGLTVEAYLKNEFFVKKYLTKEQHQYALEIYSGNDMMAKCVLNWTMENLVPFKFTPKEKVIYVSYEETVEHPLEMIDYLARKLDLTNVMEMQKTHNKPSNSSRLSTNETKEKIKNNQSFLGNWRKKISEEEEQKLLDIPLFFGIDAYTCDKDLPTTDYLLFKNI